MKNTLTDLNNHLFVQMERLSDENITKDKLEFEAKRAKNITSVAKEIIANASLALDIETFVRDDGDINKKDKLPSMLGVSKTWS